MRLHRYATCAFVMCSAWGMQLGCTGRALAPPEDGGVDLAAGIDLAGIDLAGLDLAKPFDPCPAGTNFIYTIESDSTLSRFSPTSAQFFDVGTIACPTMLDGMPNSMAVDRQGNAWLNFSSGELFRLLTQSLTCSATPFDPGEDGFEIWGMSFAENAPGSSDETLFIADAQDTSATLAQLDLNGFVLENSLTLQGGSQPELTGDDQGNLWGFFPTGAPPFIARINKKNGKLDRHIGLGALAGTPQAWGVASYQGDFYVFLQRDQDDSSSVYRVDGKSGKITTLLTDTGRTVVGVGVATCAGNGPG